MKLISKEFGSAHSDLKLAGKLFDEIKGTLSTSPWPGQCLLKWLVQQEKDLREWAINFSENKLKPVPLSYEIGRVKIYLGLLKCLADKKKNPPKDKGSKVADIISGLVVDFVMVFSPSKECIPASPELQVLVLEDIVANKFDNLLRRAIDSNNKIILKWLINWRTEIDTVSEPKINPDIWKKAKELYDTLTKTVAFP